MKSELALRLDGIQARLRPLLAEHGFRMRGRGFNRTTEDGLTQVVDIQMGRFEPPGFTEIPGFRTNLYGKFTLNLGIYVPEYAEASRIVAKGFVRESFCTIRSRIGTLSPEQGEIWWDIDNDPSSLHDELWRRIERYGLPFLARFGSRESILRECQAAAYEVKVFFPVQRMVCATIQLKRGDRSEARTLLVDHLEQYAHRPNHLPYVYEFAERIGVSLPRIEPSV